MEFKGATGKELLRAACGSTRPSLNRLLANSRNGGACSVALSALETGWHLRLAGSNGHLRADSDVCTPTVPVADGPLLLGIVHGSLNTVRGQQ